MVQIRENSALIYPIEPPPVTGGSGATYDTIAEAIAGEVALVEDVIPGLVPQAGTTNGILVGPGTLSAVNDYYKDYYVVNTSVPASASGMVCQYARVAAYDGVTKTLTLDSNIDFSLETSFDLIRVPEINLNQDFAEDITLTHNCEINGAGRRLKGQIDVEALFCWVRGLNVSNGIEQSVDGVLIVTGCVVSRRDDTFYALLVDEDSGQARAVLRDSEFRGLVAGRRGAMGWEIVNCTDPTIPDVTCPLPMAAGYRLFESAPGVGILLSMADIYVDSQFHGAIFYSEWSLVSDTYCQVRAYVNVRSAPTPVTGFVGPGLGVLQREFSVCKALGNAMLDIYLSSGDPYDDIRIVVQNGSGSDFWAPLSRVSFADLDSFVGVFTFDADYDTTVHMTLPGVPESALIRTQGTSMDGTVELGAYLFFDVTGAGGIHSILRTESDSAGAIFIDSEEIFIRSFEMVYLHLIDHDLDGGATIEFDGFDIVVSRCDSFSISTTSANVASASDGTITFDDVDLDVSGIGNVIPLVSWSSAVTGLTLNAEFYDVRLDYVAPTLYAYITTRSLFDLQSNGGAVYWDSLSFEIEGIQGGDSCIAHTANTGDFEMNSDLWFKNCRFDVDGHGLNLFRLDAGGGYVDMQMYITYDHCTFDDALTFVVAGAMAYFAMSGLTFSECHFKGDVIDADVDITADISDWNVCVLKFINCELEGYLSLNTDTSFTNSWACCAVSSTDGSVMLAGGSPGRLWLSTDSGATWAEVQPAGAIDQSWTCCAVDADGSVLLAGVNGGRLWLSTDSGANWSEMQPAGAVNQNWRCCAVDSDGSVLLAGVYGGRLWLSVNTGANWAEVQPAGNVNRNWNSCSVDTDGSVMLAAAFTGELWYSSNTGANWTQAMGPALANWACCAVSLTNGSVMLAGEYGGRVWLSVNTGANWTEVRPAGNVNQNWRCCSVDADGSVLLVGDEGSANRLWKSTDGGTTWILATTAVNMWFVGVASSIRCCALDADGSVMLMGMWTSGKLSRSVDTGASWVPATLLGGGTMYVWSTVVAVETAFCSIVTVNSSRPYYYRFWNCTFWTYLYYPQYVWDEFPEVIRDWFILPCLLDVAQGQLVTINNSREVIDETAIEVLEGVVLEAMYAPNPAIAVRDGEIFVLCKAGTKSGDVLIVDPATPTEAYKGLFVGGQAVGRALEDVGNTYGNLCYSSVRVR